MPVPYIPARYNNNNPVFDNNNDNSLSFDNDAIIRADRSRYSSTSRSNKKRRRRSKDKSSKSPGRSLRSPRDDAPSKSSGDHQSGSSSGCSTTQNSEGRLVVVATKR